jgi:hypothetical protein
MNPFREDTKTAQAFERLGDLRWHCAKHELPGTQSAGLVKRIVDRGYAVDKIMMYCRVCREETTHRKLESLQPHLVPDPPHGYTDGA